MNANDNRIYRTANECADSNCCEKASAQDSTRYVRIPIEVAAEGRFCDAIDACIRGHRITRAGWNAGGQYVTAQYPDKHSRMTQPYLVLKNAQGDLLPWVPSQGDLFARDWAVIPIQPAHA